MGMTADVDFESMAKEPVKQAEKKETATAEKKVAVMTGELKVKEDK